MFFFLCGKPLNIRSEYGCQVFVSGIYGFEFWVLLHLNDRLANLLCLENWGWAVDFLAIGTCFQREFSASEMGSGAAELLTTTSPEKLTLGFFDDDLTIEVQTSDFQIYLGGAIDFCNSNMLQ